MPDESTCSELKNTLEVLGDKWSAIILWSLEKGSLRFNDIQAATEGINPRTLRQRLDMLEEHGLITKQEYKEYPPRTEYSITEKGADLGPVFQEMTPWSKRYLGEAPASCPTD